jgi:hypothetical protein
MKRTTATNLGLGRLRWRSCNTVLCLTKIHPTVLRTHVRDRGEFLTEVLC